MDFLNELKESKDKSEKGEGKDSQLEKIVKSTKTVTLQNIEVFATTFETPKYKKTEQADTVKITYSVPAKQAEAVRKSLGVKSWTDVGRKTFEYYLKQEGEE